MRTYSFDELRNDAKDAAIARYNLELPMPPQFSHAGTNHVRAQRLWYAQAFGGWRFTEHGERIA